MTGTIIATVLFLAISTYAIRKNNEHEKEMEQAKKEIEQIRQEKDDEQQRDIRLIKEIVNTRMFNLEDKLSKAKQDLDKEKVQRQYDKEAYDEERKQLTDEHKRKLTEVTKYRVYLVRTKDNEVSGWPKAAVVFATTKKEALETMCTIVDTEGIDINQLYTVEEVRRDNVKVVMANYDIM